MALKERYLAVITTLSEIDLSRRHVYEVGFYRVVSVDDKPFLTEKMGGNYQAIFRDGFREHHYLRLMDRFLEELVAYRRLNPFEGELSDKEKQRD